MELEKNKQYKCKVCQKLFAKSNSLQVVCGIDCAIVLGKQKLKVIDIKEKKEKNKELIVLVYAKENKQLLQSEINKLARLIDAKFGLDKCIDCNKTFGKQIDAAHYHSRGANSSLRYNLDNLHSASSQCNQYSNSHITGYAKGLESRYSKEYADYVINQLPLKYQRIDLTAKDIAEKLKLVRKLVREFDTFLLESSLQARKLFNEIIGIYN